MWGLQGTIALISLAIWVYLLAFRGQFWRTDQQLEALPTELSNWPSIAVIIPARNEADLIATVLTSLFAQDYRGDWQIYLVDDNSSDHTAEIAQSIAVANDQTDRLHILAGQALPSGWTGKLWALHQGIEVATADRLPEYFLLTDADIQHDRRNLTNLVTKAVTENRDLVSLMVRLRCESFWERLLIPAFVFFFAKLYPFRQVNDPNHPIAAAAGGCSLVNRSAIEAIGGIAILKDALIDDCTLAAKVKHRPHPPTQYHNIWLGLSQTTHSLRPYENLDSIWQMVARTAYTQLNYSPFLLIGTLIGMYLVYLAAPICLITSAISHQPILWLINLITYALIVIAYIPIARFYQIAWVYPFCLPAIGLLYTLMTVDSARQHWQGKGGKWKGRSY
jgi:hopene-associated glycosyltransferase HpnB